MPERSMATKDKVKRVDGFPVGAKRGPISSWYKYNFFLFRLLVVLELATGSFLIKWKVDFFGVLHKSFAKYIAPRNGDQLSPFR